MIKIYINVNLKYNYLEYLNIKIINKFTFK